MITSPNRIRATCAPRQIPLRNSIPYQLYPQLHALIFACTEPSFRNFKSCPSFCRAQCISIHRMNLQQLHLAVSITAAGAASATARHPSTPSCATLPVAPVSIVKLRRSTSQTTQSRATPANVLLAMRKRAPHRSLRHTRLCDPALFCKSNFAQNT